MGHGPGEPGYACWLEEDRFENAVAVLPFPDKDQVKYLNFGIEIACMAHPMFLS